jgi:hypothetical protein
MAYIGRYQLGETLPLLAQTHDANGVAATPADVPTVKIWNSAGALVLARKMPSIERFTQTGRFLLPVFLNGVFATDLYRAVYHYNVSTYRGLDVDYFQVIDGGNADGNVISMYFFDRPQAKYIVYQTDAGVLIQGRNPTV